MSCLSLRLLLFIWNFKDTAFVTNVLYERENNFQHADRIWLEVVDKEGLQYIQKDHIAHGFISRLCYLRTKENMLIRGAGKGVTVDAIDISAKFEALEYYFSGSSYYPQANILADATEISESYKLLLCRMDTAVFLNETQSHIKIPWLLYKEYKSKDEYALPLACADLSYFAAQNRVDTFNYSKCNIYSSSNGLASGSTYEEALIHAILELMERDAYSYFLIDTYVLKKAPLKIDKNMLPVDLHELIKVIEKNHHNRIIIIKMYSRYGIEAYLAVFQKNNFQLRPRGFGASLVPRHAIERAISELVQSYNLMQGNYDTNQINKARLNKNVLINSFLKLDLKKTVESIPGLIEFQTNTRDFTNVKLSEYLDYLIELVYNQSSSLFVNIAYKNVNGLTCLRAIIPETEEFFLATHYLKLEPKNKMKAYIYDYLEADFSWDNY
jgi:ribosomal protein S12 methylthiotransferase accessory factor